MGVDNVAIGFVEGFAGFGLDEIGVGVLCLEIAAGVGEGRLGLEVGVDLDNVALDEFGGFELDKHVDVADFDLDDIGGVDVYVGIGHLEHVSSPYSSP